MNAPARRGSKALHQALDSIGTMVSVSSGTDHAVRALQALILAVGEELGTLRLDQVLRTASALGCAGVAVQQAERLIALVSF